MRNFLLVFILILSSYANGATGEKLGDLSLDRLYIKPEFSAAEPKTASFEFFQALVGVSWKNDASWSAKFALGTRDLVGLPARYGEPAGINGNPRDLGLVEAYGEVDTGLGQIQFGLIPLKFGLEGRDMEEQLWFPRGFLYQKRYVALRDLGLAYAIKNSSYYTRFAVHNGEGGVDLDNRAWFTAQWGILNEKQLDVGLSVQVGETTVESTAVAGNASQDEFFNSTEDTKLRLANFYASAPFSKWVLRTEVYLAEVLTEPKQTNQFSGWYLELKRWMGLRMALLARYEELRKAPIAGISKEMSATLGLAWHNWNKTSTIFLYATKKYEDPIEIQNDEFKLVWRWTPMVFDL